LVIWTLRVPQPERLASGWFLGWFVFDRVWENADEEETGR